MIESVGDIAREPAFEIDCRTGVLSRRLFVQNLGRSGSMRDRIGAVEDGFLVWCIAVAGRCAVTDWRLVLLRGCLPAPVRASGIVDIL